MSSAREVDKAIYTILDRVDPMAIEYMCSDADGDCPGNGGPVNCWLHDPSKGWCPFIKQGPEE